MKRKTYICIAGRPGSGKETAYHHLRNKLEALGKRTSIHHFSDMLNEDLFKYGIPNNRPNQQTLSTFLRTAPWRDKILRRLPKKWAQGLMSRQMQKRALADTTDFVFLDGVRRPSDLGMLRIFPRHILIGIERNARLRWQGLRKRADRPGDAKKTWKKFLIEDRAEPEQQIDRLVARADIRISNNGTFEDLDRQLDEVVTKLRKR